MDTRNRIFSLLDFSNFHNKDATLEDAAKLINGIPSITLLGYISGFSVNLYLNEQSENAGKVQKFLLISLLGKTGEEYNLHCQNVIDSAIKKKQSPMLFWNYSNLVFYGLIFDNFNDFPARELTPEEAKKVFEAYLIVNLHNNNKIKISLAELEEAKQNDKIESVTLPNFLYQKDYSSTTDFNNQIVRGAMLFEYAEGHKDFANPIRNYYKSIGVAGWRRLYQNILTLFIEIGVDKLNEPKKNIANLFPFKNEVDFEFINNLCINPYISDYQEDVDFKLLRSKMLFKINDYQYYILNVNFLIDQLYKAQVFSINSYFSSEGITKEFLSIKAKEFAENIYLKQIIKDCFPKEITHFGETAINSNNEELCDIYLRSGNDICLFEFKDVMLNGRIKNSKNNKKILKELDVKFVKNKKNKQKGITQLARSIADIDKNSISFDSEMYLNSSAIYPIILYTDNSFNFEGVNKIYSEKFQKLMTDLQIINIEVKPLVFINLSFFEAWEDYLKNDKIDFFQVLREYYKHILIPKFALTPFEVFCSSYLKDTYDEKLENNDRFKKVLSTIIKS